MCGDMRRLTRCMRLRASPHPHALISAVDAAAARALPGVSAVLLLDDITPAMAKPHDADLESGHPLDRCWRCAADGEVSYVGEPVALVLAKIAT